MSHSGSPWPAIEIPPVTYETLPWVFQIDPDLPSRRQRERTPPTYDAAIPPEIGRISLPVSAAMAAATEEASTAIGRLDQHVTSSLGPADLAPMQSVLLRSESAASSQIENLTVGARQLALAELGCVASTNARLVVRNVRAMQAAVHLADQLSADSILAVHSALLPQEGGGRWRDQQVWIGSSGWSPVDAQFVPPHHRHVPGLIADLVTFLARDDLPVLIQAAVAHAQFETIHPFTDGNGRTGRALLHAMLRNKGLTARVTVPISAGLLAQPGSYVEALTAYRHGDLGPIVATVCEASHRAVVQGRWLVDELGDVRERWTRTLSPRAGSAAASLIGLLLGQPAVTTSYVTDRLGVSYTAASRAIDQAMTAGILVPSTDQRRNRVWLAPEVLGTLDEFAARSGRRHPATD